MMLGQVLGILAEERIGLNVEYVNCEDEISCHMAMLGCSGWEDASCTLQYNLSDAVASGGKLYGDPLPDIMVDLESWPAAQNEDYMEVPLLWAQRPTSVLGSTGFIVRNGMYVFPAAAERAWTDTNTVLAHYLAYTTDAAARYLVAPSFYTRLGVVPEVQGCDPSLDSGMKVLVEMGFSCNNSWWRAPACTALGDSWSDRCVAVLDDDWAYPKPDLYKFMADSSMRVALLVVGYTDDTFYTVALEMGIVNTTFLSWTTDTTFFEQAPVRVAFPEAEDMLISKLAWTPMLNTNPKLKILLQQMSVDSQVMAQMLNYNNVAVSAGYGPIELDAPGFAKKVTCDWMRAHDATWESWLPSPLTCTRGSVFVSASLSCRLCPEGRSWVEGVAGQSQPNCVDCPAGRFTAEAGMTACTRCPAGFFQSASGASNCVACEQGFYQESLGQAACTPCPTSFLTHLTGTRNRSECICPRGTYLRRLEECVSCEAELDCAGGTARPAQKAGFYVEIVDPAIPSYTIWTCKNSEECPAGPAGGCAIGRKSRACLRCIDHTYASDKGECAECRAGDVAICSVLGFLGMILCIAFPLLPRKNISAQRLSQLTIAMTAGQLLAAIQAFSSFRELSVGWVEPVKTLLSLTQMVTADFNNLRMMCILGDNIFTAFIVKLVAFPCGVLLLCVGGLLSRCTRKPISQRQLFNMVGTVLFTVYIGICLAVLLPLQCKRNPFPNTERSMASLPGVVCWKGGNHVVLVSLAILGFLLYPGALMSLAFWVTYTYPAQVAAGHGLKMSVQYSFLFGRFRTERYYFGCIFLMRNLGLALIPVILPDEGVLSIVMMAWVVIIGMSLSGTMWPWRSTIANVSDQCISGAFVLIAITAAPLVGHSDDHSALNGLVFGMAISMVSAALLFMLVALYIRLRAPNSFGLFLCHHKAGSGVLCRFIKMVVQQHSNCLVFIDSDALQSLDVLFDTVRCFTKNLVVVATPHVFERMWCAGEIVTATVNKVNIIPIFCEGYEQRTEYHFNDIGTVWTDEQINLLLSYGITIDMVKDAYRQLVLLEALTMPRFGAKKDQENVVIDLLSRLRLNNKIAFAEKEGLSETCRVNILGNCSDPEAVSICRVVQMLLRLMMQEEVGVLYSMDDVKKVGAATDFHLVVILTGGLLASPLFAEMFFSLTHMKNQCPITTVNASSSFEFPSIKFFKELEHHGLGVPGLGPEEGPALSAAYRTLMNVLAKPLTPLGSQGLIERQVYEICIRFCPPERAMMPAASRRSFNGSLNIISRLGTKLSPRQTAIGGSRESSGEDAVCSIASFTAEGVEKSFAPVAVREAEAKTEDCTHI